MKENKTLHYLYLLEFWRIYILLCFLNLIGSILFLVIGIFTLFIPFSIFRSFFLILPHICIAYAHNTSSNTFNGYEILSLTYKYSKTYFWFLCVAHVVVCNLCFGLYLLNYFVLKVNLANVISSNAPYYLWVLSFFMLFYWLITCVYAKLLISKFETEKGVKT